jgi:hypothetical protein
MSQHRVAAHIAGYALVDLELIERAAQADVGVLRQSWVLLGYELAHTMRPYSMARISTSSKAVDAIRKPP